VKNPLASYMRLTAFLQWQKHERHRRRRHHDRLGPYAKAISTVTIRCIDPTDRTKRAIAGLYKISGDSSTCEENRQIALRHGQSRHGQVWQALAAILAGSAPVVSGQNPLPSFRRKSHLQMTDVVHKVEIETRLGARSAVQEM
jgi:hypothetical protein